MNLNFYFSPEIVWILLTSLLESYIILSLLNKLMFEEKDYISNENSRFKEDLLVGFLPIRKFSKSDIL